MIKCQTSFFEITHLEAVGAADNHLANQKFGGRSMSTLPSRFKKKEKNMALQNQKMTPVYFFKVLLLATISILALNFCLTKMPNPAKERFETMINEAIRLVESGEKDSVRFHAVSSLFPDKYLIVYRNKDGKVVTEWTNN